MQRNEYKIQDLKTCDDFSTIPSHLTKYTKYSKTRILYFDSIDQLTKYLNNILLVIQRNITNDQLIITSFTPNQLYSSHLCQEFELN